MQILFTDVDDLAVRVFYTVVWLFNRILLNLIPLLFSFLPFDNPCTCPDYF